MVDRTARPYVFALSPIFIIGCPERFEPEGAVGTAVDDGIGSVEDSDGEPGSCVGHCGAGADGCFCTPTCTQLGTCCADYEEACPSCTSNTECSDEQVCSVSTQHCTPAYGHDYDVAVHFETTTGVCWDQDASCEPDPLLIVCHDTLLTCDFACPEIVVELPAVVDAYEASWPTFSLVVNDGDILKFLVGDEDQFRPQQMLCCPVPLEGVGGVVSLKDGHILCENPELQNGLLELTFTPQ